MPDRRLLSSASCYFEPYYNLLFVREAGGRNNRQFARFSRLLAFIVGFVLLLSVGNILSFRKEYSKILLQAETRSSFLFVNPQDYRDAFQGLVDADLQSFVGAPLDESYEAALDRYNDVQFQHLNLTDPPPQCRRFFATPEAPFPVANIDFALQRMLGERPDFISTRGIRQSTQSPRTSVVYVLRDGVLYFDNRTHPSQCVHPGKQVAIWSFLILAAQLAKDDPSPASSSASSLPSHITFRHTCLDNPPRPYQGTWTYCGSKDPAHSILTFPDSQFLASRWHRVGVDAHEPELPRKRKRAAWRGGGTGYAPMKNLYGQGHLEQENRSALEFLRRVTSRRHFVRRYRWSRRVAASHQFQSMARLRARNRVLLALAGNSFASSGLELMASKSVAVVQDFVASSFEDFFFVPGVHFVALPRSLDDGVLQRILDAVFDDRRDHLRGLFSNMTRLASTTANAVANDDALAACFTHRAAAIWRALLVDDYDGESENNDRGGHLVALLNLTAYAGKIPLLPDNPIVKELLETAK